MYVNVYMDLGASGKEWERGGRKDVDRIKGTELYLLRQVGMDSHLDFLLTSM